MPHPLSLAALALCVNYANADATSDYIAQLQWPVSVLAPKMHFMAVSPSLAPPWCNYDLMGALAHALYLDEPTMPPTPTDPDDTTTVEPDSTTTAVTTKKAMFEDFLQLPTTPISFLENWAKPLAFFSDIYEYIDGPVKKVPAGSTSVLPIYLDKNATPEAKFRLLVTTIALTSTKNKSLNSIIQAHARLSREPHKQKQIIEALMSGDSEARAELVSLKMDDDALMDSIPETLVGFLSSRVLTELLSNLMTDAWGQSLIHDTKTLSITDGFCRAAAIGIKTDFMFDVNICTLITLIVNFLGCSFSEATVSCSADDIPKKYELANCELLPSEQSSAAVVDLSLMDSVDDAVDEATHSFTEAGRAAEGPTFYLLQLAQNNWTQATGQRWCQKLPTDENFITELIPGWPIVREIWLAQENSAAEINTATKVSPFTAISKKQTTDGSCEFLIVNRGSATNWEWYMNLGMAHTILPQAQNPQVKAHMAYFVLGNSVVQEINAYLADEFAAGRCTPTSTTVWFHGHSLGGGQSNMQSLLLASYWANLDTPLTVNSVGFAPLRIFNEEAAKLQRTLVNTRNMVFNYDMVPHVGCPDTGIPRCSTKYWSAGMSGSGIDEPSAEHNGLINIEGYRDFRYAKRFDTEETNITQTLNFFDDRRFLYIPAGGALLVQLSHLYVNIPTNLQMGIAHGCSYQCFVSRNFCSVNPAQQMSCVRAPVNMNTPSNCLNETMDHANIYGSNTDKAASLDCSPEYWGYDKLPNYSEKDPYAVYDSSLPYFCHSMISGLGPTTIANAILS